MKIPCVTLIDSIVTSREIGTKFIKAMNHTPTLKQNKDQVVDSSYFWFGKMYG